MVTFSPYANCQIANLGNKTNLAVFLIALGFGKAKVSGCSFTFRQIELVDYLTINPNC